MNMFQSLNLTVEHLPLPNITASMQNTVTSLTPLEHVPSIASLTHFVGHSIPMAMIDVWQMLTISFFWKALLILAIAVNFKNFPLIYHLRILNGIRFILKSQRPPTQLGPDQLFQPLITSSKAPLMEIDVFGHKSNSTYFSDIDIARAHFATTMFGVAIEKFRGSTTMNGLSGKPRSAFTMPLGAVSCSFRRELKPYEAYDMWTRILSWDEKWFYLVTHFVKKGAKIEPSDYTMYPRQSRRSSEISSRRSSAISLASNDKTINSAICASAMSKVVFKNGRITIAPEVMLEAAGLLPPEAADINGQEAELARAQIAANVVDRLPKTEAVETVQHVDIPDDDLNNEGSRRSSLGENTSWTRQEIERERQRGMKMASKLAAQTKLEEEFVGSEGPALCRHYDGYGLEGVVSTLAQLGKLSKYQLL